MAGWWGSWAWSPCLATEPTMAEERPGKLTHFAEVGWARASEGTKEGGRGREPVVPTPCQQAVLSSSAFNSSWLCLH